MRLRRRCARPHVPQLELECQARAALTVDGAREDRQLREALEQRALTRAFRAEGHEGRRLPGRRVWLSEVRVVREHVERAEDVDEVMQTMQWLGRR